jgi:hypothetical protein
VKRRFLPLAVAFSMLAAAGEDQKDAVGKGEGTGVTTSEPLRPVPSASASARATAEPPQGRRTA